MKTKKRSAAVPRKKAVTDPLRDWATLNVALMKMAEPDVVALLARERRGADRLTFTLRIHARLNRLRRDRERHELTR